MNADAHDLLAARPDARIAGVSLGGDVEDAERCDERLLERAQVPMEILLVAAEIENRIAHELTRPVESYVATALDFKDVDAGRSEEMSRM